MNNKSIFFSIKNFNIIVQVLNEYFIMNNRNTLSKNDYMDIYNIMNNVYDNNYDLSTLNKIVIHKYLINNKNKSLTNNLIDIHKKNIEINNKLKNEKEIIDDKCKKRIDKIYNDIKPLKLKMEDELVDNNIPEPIIHNHNEYSLLDYIQSKPDDKYKQIEHKLLIIDSRERNNISTTNPNSYTIQLKYPLKNIEEINLLSAEIPITKYNINDTNNLFTFNLGVSSFDIQLDNGIYDIIDLRDEVQSLIQNEITSYGIRSFTIDYDNIEKKYIFKNEIIFNGIYDENLILWFPGHTTGVSGSEVFNFGVSSYITGSLSTNAIFTTTTSAFDNGSFLFDGTDDHIQLVNGGITFDVNDPFTLSLYLFLDNDTFALFTGNNNASFFQFRQFIGYRSTYLSSISNVIYMRYTSTSELLFIGVTNISLGKYKVIDRNLNDIFIGNTHTFDFIPWDDGNFHQHAFVFRKDITGTIDYYFDGNYLTTVFNGNTFFNFKSIGSGYSGDNLSLTGNIDDYRLYNTALTADGISRIYQENSINDTFNNAILRLSSDYEFNMSFPNITGLSDVLGFTSSSITSSFYTEASNRDISKYNLTNTCYIKSEKSINILNDQFIVMDIKNIKSELVSNNELFEQRFAKIPLTNTLYSIEYFDQKKLKAKKIFNPPLSKLDYLDIEFRDKDGNLYDFNGHEHSFSLDIKLNQYQLPLHIQSNEINQS